jgi:hypothetical protein
MNTLILVALSLILSVPAYAACTSPAGVAGTWNFNPPKETYAFCDGTNWVNTTATDTGMACSAPGVDSTLNYDPVGNTLTLCFGGGLYTLGSGIAGDPCTTEGAFNYDTTYASMQYCDGTNWQNW